MTGPLQGASCQQASELLAEHWNICLSAKTVGRILKASGIPLAHTHKAARRRKSRDRLPQAGICTLEDDNAFPPGFIERFNRRFAVEPANPVSGDPSVRGIRIGKY